MSDPILIGLIIIIAFLVAVALGYYVYRRKIKSSKDKERNDDVELGTQVTRALISEPKKPRNVLVVMMLENDEQAPETTMKDFMLTIEKRVKCKVYAWRAPAYWQAPEYMWDNFAQAGYDSAIDKIKKGARVIWVDTEKTRRAIETPNNPEMAADMTEDQELPLATFLNYAASHKNPDTEDQDHFVVRFEESINETEIDPFSRISTGMRYMLPIDLDHLISKLSE